MSNFENHEVVRRIVRAGRRNRISRRDFMSQAVAAGVTVSAAAALWSANAAAEEPMSGGTYRLGLHDGNPADQHDPGKYQSVGEIQLAHTHRSYLTEITEENGLGPDMAESWSATPDAKKWTFELAKDAAFHDGRPFTAKDAIASLNHHRGEASTSAAKSLLDPVTEIRADGDHAFTIELHVGFADLPWVLTDYHLAMLPANADGGIEWESGIGAGPYRIESYEPGVGAELVRHDGWHRAGAHFDAVQFTVLNDPNARQTALVTGAVDAISSVDLKTLSLLGRDPNIEIDNVPSGSAITFPMHCDTPPFDDNHVRLALKHAIDREEIVEKILFGTGTPGNDFHLSPGMPYYPAGIEQRVYDPDKARFHLQQAGLDSLRVDLHAADSVLPGAVDMVVLYSEQAKAAGIEVVPVRQPGANYWADIWLVEPFTFVKWGARPTPDNIFSLVYSDGAPWNEARWSHGRFNQLLQQAKAELDDGVRADLYREMSVIARDEGGTIIPLFVNYVYARRNNLRHSGSLAASWECDGARSAHRWWLA